MDGLFTDTPDYTEVIFPDSEPAPDPVQVQEPLPVPESPVPGQAGSPGSPSVFSDEEASGGVEALPDSPAVTPEADAGTPDAVPEASPDVTDTSEQAVEEPPASVDYSELLAVLQAQNEQITVLQAELQKSGRQLSSIQNALPVLIVLLSMVLGVLLMQILSSFFRP